MNYIAHHGIKNQKWGVRRFQNEDGTLTEAGKRRYSKGVNRVAKQIAKASEKNQAHQVAYDAIRNGKVKGIKQFNRENPEFQKLVVDAAKKTVSDHRLNREVIDRLKKDGYSDEVLKNPKHPEFLKAYETGRSYAEKIAKEPWYSDPVKEWLKSSQEYESKAHKFLDSLNLDSLKVSSKGTFDLTYNAKDQKIRQSTVQEILALEMLRAAKGHI